MSSLNPSVLLYGVCCLVFFFLWLLGRRVETFEDAFDSLPAAGVAFGALLIAPFFFYYGWQQFGAKDRLEKLGLPACPAFGHAVGAQGGREPRAIWRFEAPDDPKPVLAYYQEAATRHGWKIDRRKNGLLLEKDGMQVALWHEPHDGQTQFVIQRIKPKAP